MGSRRGRQPADGAPPAAALVSGDDDAVVAVRLGARLEGLEDDVAIARLRRPPRRRVDADEPDAGRDAELDPRLALESGGHEVAEDGRRVARPLLVIAEGPRLVEADIDCGDEIGREADEPIVAVVARRSGLAGERLADAGDDTAGAALHDALQDRHHLVGGKRILDLL